MFEVDTIASFNLILWNVLLNIAYYIFLIEGHQLTSFNSLFQIYWCYHIEMDQNWFNTVNHLSFASV